MTEHAASWQPPVEFDGFRVIRLLGAGAMGRVYLARETMLERDVAVKFIAADQPDPATLERFLIEARAVARLQHPNVVSVYRIGSIDSRPYVVSELVTGQSLDQVATPLPWRRALAIGLGLVRGLAAAQARGILHRDIKPANVMVTEAGEVKLVDFGIAKLVDTLPSPELADGERGTPPTVVMLESAPTMTDLAIATPMTPSSEPMLTRAGTMLGTPRYLAPELWAGSRASLRSDVYSFGIVVFELCAGPGSAGNGKDRRTPALRSLAPDVPARLAEVIDRCVAFDPDARFASALEAREALEQAAAELTVAPASIAAPRLLPGELIAQRYEVLRATTAIGAHTAYEVLDRELDEACSLVLLDAPDARAIRQDVRLARRLSHPNACRVLDLGQHGTNLFVTTEQIHGPTLREVMRGAAAGAREPLSFGRKVDLALQIAAALGTAHRLGIAHRAVSAELVVIEPQRAVLVGFGLIAASGDALDDQRAWAALAYELLAGHPIGAELPDSVGDAIVRTSLDAMFARALAASPADRFATLDGAAEAFAFAARGTARVTAQIPRIVEPEESSRVATTLVFVPGGDQTLDGLEATLTELGGTVVSSKPEEIVAMFGAPRALGDDVVRAARAAHALIERVPGGRVGLATGRVEGTQHGEVLRRAVALVGAATAGDVIASESTVRHLRGRFATVELTPGDATTLRWHRVLPNASEHGQPKRGGRGGASLDALAQPPLHGRTTELAQLEHLILGAFEQRVVRTALILGPPGIGKSRLRLELERELADRRDVEWLVGRATPLGGGVPFGLLRDASREWFAVTEAAAAGGRPAAFAAARRWLEARASLRPVVLAVDDLHWADDASRELIDALRRDLDQVPVALLLFGRPGHAPSTDVDLAIELMPLDAAAARQLLERLAPTASEATREHVIARAGGNPFFLEELAHHIVDSGDAGARDLPVSVELAIQARLDQLPATELRVAVAASVIGRELERGALEAALAGEPLPDLDGALAELARREIIVRLDHGYAFHHVLIREVAYARTAELARRRIHAALAGYYDARVARHRRDPALLLALANHRDAAGDRIAARDAYRAAGELALSLAAYREANLAVARAEELSDGHDAALLELAGDALLQLDAAAATDRLERALALATTPLAHARVLYKLGTAAYHRSEFQPSVELFERGLAKLEPVTEASDRETKLLAARLLAMLGSVISYDLGDHRRGLPHAERAVALFEAVGDLLELAGGLSRLGGAYLRAGRWNDRLRCNLRHLQIAETLGDIDRQLAAHVNLGINYHSVGKLDAALEHTRKGLAFAVRCGRATSRALAHNNLGVILADLDQPEAARKELLASIALAERTGYTRVLGETYSTLALLDLRAGDLASAEAQIRLSADDARAAHSPLYEGVAERILAGIAAAAGRSHTEVNALLASAHAKIGDDDYEQARTTALEAKLAARAGLDASALRERALATFELLGATLDIAKLDDLHDVR